MIESSELILEARRDLSSRLPQAVEGVCSSQPEIAMLVLCVFVQAKETQHVTITDSMNHTDN